ncbi:MAG: ABC transporter permease [Candidatus Baldrarchaeia archaeon]
MDFEGDFMGLKTLLKSGIMLDLYFYKNNRGSLVSMLLWPYLMLALILGMGMMLGNPEAFKENIGLSVNPIIYFLASTLIAMASVDVMWGVGGNILFYRWAGTLPYVLLSPNRTSSTLVFTYVPRYLLFTFIQILEFSPLILILEGFYQGIFDIGIFILAATVGMLPLLGFSALFASFLLTIKEESNVLSWLNPIILLFSGAFYPVYLLPYWAKLISQLLPSTYTIELARTVAIIGSSKFAAITSLIGMLAGMAFMYNALAYVFVGAGERKAMKEGAI